MNTVNRSVNQWIYWYKSNIVTSKYAAHQSYKRVHCTFLPPLKGSCNCSGHRCAGVPNYCLDWTVRWVAFLRRKKRCGICQRPLFLVVYVIAGEVCVYKLGNWFLFERNESLYSNLSMIEIEEVFSN